MNVNQCCNTTSRSQQMKDNTFQKHLLHGSKTRSVKREIDVTPVVRSGAKQIYKNKTGYTSNNMQI